MVETKKLYIVITVEITDWGGGYQQVHKIYSEEKDLYKTLQEELGFNDYDIRFCEIFEVIKEINSINLLPKDSPERRR